MKRLYRFEILGFIFVVILGTLMHFAFNFFNQSQLIAVFVPVNESVWEHLKLAFWPYVFFAVLEIIVIKGKVNTFIAAKGVGVLFMLAFIVAFFYAYSAILGTNLLIIDILTFIAAVAIGFIISYKLISHGESSFPIVVLGIMVLIGFASAMWWFTYNPPFIDLFLDSTGDFYGIKMM